MNSSLLLKDTSTIAIVGLSDNPQRSSYQVAQYLSNYYDVIPVNPNIKNWEGKTSYPTLKDIPCKIDLVNIFRRSEEVAQIVDDAVSLGIPKIWMQLGVIDHASANKAKDQGIHVVMDECIAVVHRLHQNNI
jgi:predicted CoA-binding protein